MKSINLLLQIILITICSFIFSNLVYGQNPQTTAPAASNESLSDLCNATTADLSTLDNIINGYIAGGTSKDQLLTKISEINKTWNVKILSNSCNSYRTNPITCPESSEPMKALIIANSIIAMTNSLTLQINQSYSNDLIKQAFANAVASHKDLCNKYQ